MSDFLYEGNSLEIMNEMHAWLKVEYLPGTQGFELSLRWWEGPYDSQEKTVSTLLHNDRVTRFLEFMHEKSGTSDYHHCSICKENVRLNLDNMAQWNTIQELKTQLQDLKESYTKEISEWRKLAMNKELS